jgi:transposase
MMRFYNQQHRFYAGIDLHARTMHVCVLDAAGTVVLDRNLPCHFETLLQAMAPFRDGIVLGVECMFGWYWLADRCAEHGIAFVVGHALYMKLIHGGKAKNDRLDAHKIAQLLRGGNFPLSYAYPKGMRETRDLLRRRLYLVHKRAELITHLSPRVSPEGGPEGVDPRVSGTFSRPEKVPDTLGSLTPSAHPRLRRGFIPA